MRRLSQRTLKVRSSGCAHAARVDGPTGVWTALVTRPRETSASTLRFSADGRVFLVRGGIGAGTWRLTGQHRFSFRIAEPIFDDAGAHIGWVDISQDAVRHENTFTSAGLSDVFTADGIHRYQADVQIQASLSTRPPPGGCSDSMASPR